MSLHKLALSIAFCLATIIPAYAEVTVGHEAPDLTFTNYNGETFKLTDFKHKNVVLEWTNKDCPFVMKHYKSGNMQELQSKWNDDKTVWITVASSAKGKQGYLTPADVEKLLTEQNAYQDYFVLDPTGEIGRAYGALTTPHMFIIHEGKIAYMGAIDSVASFKQEDIAGATNYVDLALSELTEGKAVTTPSTRPYGCGVKY